MFTHLKPDSPRFYQLATILPVLVCVAVGLLLVLRHTNPAPPKKIVFSASSGEGDYQEFAQLYKDIIKEDGVDVVIKSSSGSKENLQRLEDANNEVEVAFVQDGLTAGHEDPDISSLGSMFYEPLWIFYKGDREFNRISSFKNLRISIGEEGSGTHELVTSLLHSSGVTAKNSQWLPLSPAQSFSALEEGKIDVAFFLATSHDEKINALINDPRIKIFSNDQAEAGAKMFPHLHHLVLPHGAINLEKNLPATDVHLLASTATLLVKDSLHPALVYLLLKAASQIHSDAGIFEKKNEFPIDKDSQFSLNDGAKSFYKSGSPFWQKHLPFWLANLVERFLVFVIPFLTIAIPVARLGPRVIEWRVKSKIYDLYGELRKVEQEVMFATDGATLQTAVAALDRVEKKVNLVRAPNQFSNDVYGLREHIHFVRTHLLARSKF